jgi:hypothetical protein
MMSISKNCFFIFLFLFGLSSAVFGQTEDYVERDINVQQSGDCEPYCDYEQQQNLNNQTNSTPSYLFDDSDIFYPQLNLPYRSNKKIALIIGNKEYNQVSPLANTERDARDMAQSLLQNGGFEIVLGINLTRKQMKIKIDEFRQRIAAGGSDAQGVVFYAGHGFEFGGTNYLVPIDIDMGYSEQAYIAKQSISLNDVIAALNPSRESKHLVILDACRNSPFGSSNDKTLGSGGWVRFDSKGLFVAFGAEAGKTASDGIPGQNGVFTKYILEHLEEPGLTADTLFNKVKRDVARDPQAIAEPQQPIVFTTVHGDLTLHPCDANETCGNGQLYVIYAMFCLIILFVLIAILYVRNLAITNNTSMTKALGNATEGVSKFILGDRASSSSVKYINTTMDEPAISTNSKVVPRDSKSRNQGIPVGYIRHLRHNIEVGRLFSTSTLIIGRDKSAGADIVINDSRGTIARRQTQIGWDHHKKCFWVMDLGSTNGTYLDASTKMKPNEIYYVSTGQTFYLSSSRHPISIVKNETF